jgi:hypothetical protein
MEFTFWLSAAARVSAVCGEVDPAELAELPELAGLLGLLPAEQPVMRARAPAPSATAAARRWARPALKGGYVAIRFMPAG